MAVKIRLKRMGKIRAPYYRIVVADSRTKRDGRVIEEIGKYHPTEEPSFIEVDSERAQYWLGVGAQPTEQVAAILKLTGDWGTLQGRQERRQHRQDQGRPRTPSSPTRRRSPSWCPSRRSPPRPRPLEAEVEPRPPRPRSSTRPRITEAESEGLTCSHPHSNTSSGGSSITLTRCRSSQRVSPRGDVLEVRVHPDDLGRVIGRSGRTAKALRTLVTALADGKRVRVDVVDDEWPTSSCPAGRRPDPTRPSCASGASPRRTG